MDREEFCVELSHLSLTQTQQGICLLWFCDNEQRGSGFTPGEVARMLRDAGVCNPHSTKLGQAMVKSGHCLPRKGTLYIKPTSRATVAGWVESIISVPPKVDNASGYLPEAVWKGTRRGYIDKIAAQINGCYEYQFYDGASVLLRRLTEILLIECYEHLKIEAKIQNKDGDYFMLGEIIKSAVDKGELNIQKDPRKYLKAIQKAGNNAAHNRRYLAVKADLDKIDARVVVDELLHIANLK